MSEFFSKTKTFFLEGGDVKIDLDLFNYATKANLNNAKGVDKTDFTEKVDLVNIKSDKLDKLNIGKLKTSPVDLSKLSDVVKLKLLKRL